LIKDVAVTLLGEPNKHLSNDDTLRWGSRGSFKVDVPEGVWHDKEANQGGGVLDLLMRENHCDRRGALAWLVEKGLIAPPQGRDDDVTRYLYRDATGQVLYAKARIDRADQKYQYQHFDGERWRPGRNGAPAVPYRLPELLSAPAAAVLYTAEGEKHADKLASWGLLATSHKDWRRDFAEHVRRKVVIIPDNDQAGEDQAADMAKHVRSAGGEPLIVRLPDLPPAGDIIDWSGDVDQLAEIVRMAEAERASIDEPSNSDLLPSLDLVALAKVLPQPKSMVVERLAPAGEVTLFPGPGSAGKSLLGQQLATAAAAGVSCLGLTVHAGPAIYLTCEDDAEQLHWRQAHLCAAMGVDMASLAGRLHLISRRGELDNELTVVTEKGEIQPGPAYRRIAAKIRTTGARLIVLDNVAHLFAGNENDRGDVTRFVNLLNRLAGETGAAIILIAHPPKPSTPNAISHDFSGSTAWLNAVRSLFTIDRERDGEGNVLDPDGRVLKIGKANYEQVGEALRFRWHNWAFVRDVDMPKSAAAELKAISAANAENATFLRCLAQRTKELRHVSDKVGANYAPKVFATMPEAKGMAKERLARAMDRLFRTGQIERGFLWRDTAEGKNIFGLRESGNVTGNDPETRSADDRKPAEINRKTHPLDTTYQSGAAPGSAAPDGEAMDLGTKSKAYD
jgi:RecA-family ATPase